MSHYIRTALKRTARLFLRELRSPVFVSVLVVVGIYNALLASQSDALSSVFERGWIFEHAPSVLLPVVFSWVALGVTVVIWLSRVGITLVVTRQMYRIWAGEQVSISGMFRGVGPSSFIWYAAASAGLFFIAIFGAVLVWGIGWVAWKEWSIDSTLAVVLLCGLAYPVYVSWLSTTALLAVLPVDKSARARGFWYALSYRFARNLYFFYFMRVGLEYALAVIVIYIGAAVAPQSLWTHVVGSVALVVPLLFLRTATYTRTVDVMEMQTELSHALRRLPASS